MRFTKIDESKHLVGGVVYAAETEDLQGDSASASEIWGAVESFMLAGAVIKVMHQGKRADVRVVECVQFDVDTTKGGSPAPAGSWWLTVKVLSEVLWRDIRDGKLTGFSFAGRGEYIEV